MRVFLCLCLLVSPLFAAELEIKDRSIHLSGEILPDDELKFSDSIKANPNLLAVELDSRGGDVYTAMQIGNLTRRNKLNTVAVGECLSACTVIFISGRERGISEGHIGFHRVLNVETGMPVGLDDPLYNRLTIFAWGKGVDPIRFVQWMTFANPEAIYYPDESELCSAQILKPCER